MKRLLLLLFLLLSYVGFAQNSVARDWNSFVLEAIRNDYARPTVHARNLYHHSIITYDAWAVYDPSKDTYLLGDTLDGFDGLPKSAFALTNVDDKNGAYMLQNTLAKKKTYSLKSVSDYSARILENQFNVKIILVVFLKGDNITYIGNQTKILITN